MILKKASTCLQSADFIVTSRGVTLSQIFLPYVIFRSCTFNRRKGNGKFMFLTLNY